MLTPLDYTVIAIYFAGITAIGIRAGGRQRDEKDYFLGGNDLPWWAVCFSIVATETSTLTVIGIPAFAYGNNFTFLQLALGYLVGRILVSMVFLPGYYKNSLSTAYAFLGNRFGGYSQVVSSVTFLITRLLADGVRLFATAIPLKVILDAAGFSISYFGVISVIGLVTVIYTFIGGLKAVVWMDFIQLLVYMIGALVTIVILVDHVGVGWQSNLMEAGKLKMVDVEFGRSLNEVLTSPYVFITAVFGGAIFTMASHGTDHLIVQRLLACRSLKDGQKALIGSGFLVLIQFVLFLLVGALLWVYYQGATITDLGLSRADEIYPKFIIETIPPGLSGFILAGILAAAMSTLSSSLNALASSTMGDLYDRMNQVISFNLDRLKVARAFTLLWGGVFVLFASMFQSQQNPVVEIGLAIATFTYGGLLGIFLLGLTNRRINDVGAALSLIITILVMVLVIFGLRYIEGDGWVVIFGDSGTSEALNVARSVAWPLYTLLGAGIALLLGRLFSLFNLFRRTEYQQNA